MKTKDFVYVSRTRLEMESGLLHAYIGEVKAPVVYGVQGALKDYF